MATLEGHEVTRNRDWNRVRRYIPAGEAGKRHSIHFSLDGRKSVGRQGLHSERATRRRSSKEQKESAQKKGARPARTHSRIKVSCDPGEIDLGIAQGGPQHHPERCEYLDNFAIRHTASHLWPVMRRHLTGYIAFCAISRVRSILQVSAPGPKNHTHHILIAGKRPRSAQRGSE